MRRPSGGMRAVTRVEHALIGKDAPMKGVAVDIVTKWSRIETGRST